MNIVNKTKDFISNGNERSAKAKKNIVYMLLIKGLNIFFGLFTLPLTLNYVNKETYGLWVALSSMVYWISFFDIGLNNGLKNNLTAALAKKDYALCKKYVSTTYAMLALIFFPLMFILLMLAPHINWMELLNLPQTAADGLLAAICILICYICTFFVLNTINVVILADQRPADASFRTLCQQVSTIVTIWVLIKTTEGSLVNLCIALCLVPLVIVLLFNLTLFLGRYKKIAPSFKAVDFSVAPNLMRLGVKFFVIQIAAVIQFQMINFLILKYYGAADVTSYNVGYKYFNILTMVWAILISPLWVATTDAFVKDDLQWIRNAQRKYLLFWCGFVCVGIIMLAISKFVYHIWIGDSVQVEFSLSLWILIYNLVIMFGQIFVFIINGSGKLNVQTVSSLISPFVFIGSFYFMYSLELGIHAILIASVLANFYCFTLAPVQSFCLLYRPIKH